MIGGKGWRALDSRSRGFGVAVGAARRWQARDEADLAPPIWQPKSADGEVVEGLRMDGADWPPATWLSDELLPAQPQTATIPWPPTISHGCGVTERRPSLQTDPALGHFAQLRGHWAR